MRPLRRRNRIDQRDTATDLRRTPVGVRTVAHHQRLFRCHVQARLLSSLTTPSQRVGELSAEYHDAWERRDLDPDLHRKVFLQMMRSSGLEERQAQRLYAGFVDPYSWTPYPDTIEVLRRLPHAGIGIAVISNIAFDIRPAFTSIGVDGLIDEMLLSYTEGLIKHDQKLVLRACANLPDAGVAGSATAIGRSRPQVTCVRPSTPARPARSGCFHRQQAAAPGVPRRRSPRPAAARRQ